MNSPPVSIVVVAQTGPYPSHLVGGYGSPDATAADDDPAIDLAGRHGQGEREGVVRIVVVGVELRGTEIPHLLARLAEPRNESLLHLESAMVGGNCDL